MGLITTRIVIRLLTICLFIMMTFSFPDVCKAQSFFDVNTDHSAPVAQQATQKPNKAFDWVDTSSPQALFNSLICGTQRYYDLIRENGYTHENWHEIQNISKQSERLFDLRNIPPGSLHETAPEVMVLVREAIARVPLPSLDDIPDENDVAGWFQEGRSTIFRIPNTPFEIARIEDGPQAGRYQFTSETVEQAHNFYLEIKNYPYEPNQYAVKGLYEAYFMSPGPAIPHAWIQSLPQWMKLELIGQTIWQWLLLFCSSLIFLITLWVVYLITKWISGKCSNLPRVTLSLIRPMITIALAWLFTQFLLYDVRITSEIARFIVFFKHLVMLTAGVVITMSSGSILAELILNSKRLEGQPIDQQFIRLLIKICSVIIATIIVIEEMQQMGFSLATLMAGAGVGGLAIALAAQDTLKNIFGGIELSLDKPFSVGHQVRLKTYFGKIEQIGLRSTKIRTLTGHHVTIPNEEMARLDIENIDRRPYIRRRFSVTITYDTPEEKIQEAIDILLDILSLPNTIENNSDPKNKNSTATHPNVAINHPDYPPRVFLSNLNSDSLNLLVFYWHHPPDYWAYKTHESWVNLQIIKRFNKASIEFAFPTQTVHLADNDNISEDKTDLKKRSSKHIQSYTPF